MTSVRCISAFLPIIPVSVSPSARSSDFIASSFKSHQISTRCNTNKLNQNRSIIKASIILSPGQGAQFLDMGKSWREQSEASREIFEEAESILKTELSPNKDKTLSEIISSETSTTEILSRTDIAQPSIFVTSIASYKGIIEKEILKEKPKITAGLSLGEYTSLVISESITFKDGLNLVKLRGQLMQKSAEETDGSMIAVLGINEQQANEIIDKCKQNNILVAANFNAPGQIVLSGETIAINRVNDYCANDLNLKCVVLDVAGAFHSPLMNSAANELKLALKDVEIVSPKIPVLSNVSGILHDSNPDSIRQALVNQLTGSVRWHNCCQFIKDSEFSSNQWIELAPGKTLSGIMRKIDRKTKLLNMSDAPVEAEV